MDINIICLKVGNKYSAEYVNNLYNQTKKNTTLKTRFVCFTENTDNLNKNIETKPLLTTDKKINGWFHKLSFFQNKLYDLSGIIFYLDLDVIITNNIDQMLQPSDKLTIIEDWMYKKIGQKKYNSSIMKWKLGQYNDLFKNYLNNFNLNKKLIGDQDYITDTIKDVYFWPDNWILSYKFHKVYYNIPTDAKIIVFHGNPKPHEIKSSQQVFKGNILGANWIKNYWS